MVAGGKGLESWYENANRVKILSVASSQDFLALARSHNISMESMQRPTFRMSAGRHDAQPQL